MGEEQVEDTIEGEFIDKNDPKEKDFDSQAYILGRYISHLQQQEESVEVDGVKGVFR